MGSNKKRIGILTSGGDCPGLNAVIRAVVKCATHRGWDVYGIPYGTDGFIQVSEGHFQPQDLLLTEHGYDLPGVLQGIDVLQFLSGSVLGSLSKGHPEIPGITVKILAGYEQMHLDAVIAIGGDGSLRIIYDLAQLGGWNFIAIPKTIDNDVPFTEQSIGFSTAVETVTACLYDLTFTAASHDRIMVVQVMGRDAGHLALHAGIAGGADIILLPELVPRLIPVVIYQMCDRIADMRQKGRRFALVVIAEGVKTATGEKDKCIAEYLAEQIKQHGKHLCGSGEKRYCELDQIETRSTVLGHIQRSGTPVAFDRLLASAFGKKAVDLIAAEHYGQLVAWEAGQVRGKPLDQVIQVIKERHLKQICPSPVNPHSTMVQVATSLGIYLGDSAYLAHLMDRD
ncbi:MAG: ATP-dependent 6-phosphofructokinase [Thainema sp.]